MSNLEFFGWFFGWWFVIGVIVGIPVGYAIRKQNPVEEE